jgi:hypothetical protein
MADDGTNVAAADAGDMPQNSSSATALTLPRSVVPVSKAAKYFPHAAGHTAPVVGACSSDGKSTYKYGGLDAQLALKHKFSGAS